MNHFILQGELPKLQAYGSSSYTVTAFIFDFFFTGFSLVGGWRSQKFSHPPTTKFSPPHKIAILLSLPNTDFNEAAVIAAVSFFFLAYALCTRMSCYI